MEKWDWLRTLVQRYKLALVSYKLSDAAFSVVFKELNKDGRDISAFIEQKSARDRCRNELDLAQQVLTIFVVDNEDILALSLEMWNSEEFNEHD